MMDVLTQWLPDAKKTHSSGGSLGSTLYAFPVDILLTGELGAGKTSFLQGFAHSLGIVGPLTSPTYALEQRYHTATGRPLLHLDLYRLKPTEAQHLIRTTDDHAGIRCIEWADRMGSDISSNAIHLHFEEIRDGRMLHARFMDIPLPDEEQIAQWRSICHLPAHIIAHCEAVAHIATSLAEHLIAQGKLVRPLALKRAAQVHDLLRFIDFKPGGSPEGHVNDAQSTQVWEQIRAAYPGMKHEQACGLFLEKNGYAELARIVTVHGLHLPAPERTTIEQKLLFYADKRAVIDKVVTLQERFADFAKRYQGKDDAARRVIWQQEALRIEEELFPKGPPL